MKHASLINYNDVKNLTSFTKRKTKQNKKQKHEKNYNIQELKNETCSVDIL